MVEKIARDNLFAIATAYRDGTGKSMVQISKEFYGNANFFADLRAHKHSVTIDKLDTMVRAFRAKWPKGAAWPMTRPIIMGRRPQAR